MKLPKPGTFHLYPHLEPPLKAGAYTLTGELAGLPLEKGEEVEVEDLEAAIDVTAPRYALPPDQILSTFPPASARGSFGSRLPQIVLRRRTLPWERSTVDALNRNQPGQTPRPWLALVLIGPDEGNLLFDVEVAEASSANLGSEADVAKTTCLEVPVSVIAKVFPAREDLPMLCHVREVDILDTELALGDDDGWMAVVLCNRLPQPHTEYTACLINIEGLYQELPVNPEVAEDYSPDALVVDVSVFGDLDAYASADAPYLGLKKPGALVQPALAPPVLAAAQSSGVSLSPRREKALPWNTVERTVRFPVLASWSFFNTEAGDFQTLAEGVDSRLLGHVATDPESPDGGPPSLADPAPAVPAEPPTARPLPLVTATGHVDTAHETRHGDRTKAWLRGPLIPLPVERGGARPDDRYPLAHHADQLRRVIPDGREDLTYAAGFEIGRLLALSQPGIVAALGRWRRGGFGAAVAGAVAERVEEIAPAPLREQLRAADPFLGACADGAGRRFARGLLAALGERPTDLAEVRPLADPGFPVDDRAGFQEGRDARLASGLALDAELGQDGRDPLGDAERLRKAPVARGERDPSADLAAARRLLEDAAAGLAAEADALTSRKERGRE